MRRVASGRRLWRGDCVLAGCVSGGLGAKPPKKILTFYSLNMRFLYHFEVYFEIVLKFFIYIILASHELILHCYMIDELKEVILVC